MHHPILFTSPKHGGILQSSGLLDMKSLVALSRTCKANALDELSLILLIENEITRYHGVQTIKEAITFWRGVCRHPVLKQWLERDEIAAESIQVTRNTLPFALPYEVILTKMLQTIPTESERLQIVSGQGPFGKTLLHLAAESDKPVAIKTIIALCPESERLQAVSMHNSYGWTALHCAAESGNHEAVKFILSLYPETERLRAVSVQNSLGTTVLHCAARSGDIESLNIILALYPEPERERLRAQDLTDRYAQSGEIESIKAVLSLFPQSQHLQALNMQDQRGRPTVLDDMDEETSDSTMVWLSKS